MSSRPKVLHVATVDLSVKHLLLNQLKALREYGFEVHAVAAPGPNMTAVEAEGIPVHTVPLTRRIPAPVADAAALWQLFRLMRRHSFQIVHTHTPKASLLGQHAAWMAGVPLRIHTVHGLYLRNGGVGAADRFFLMMERATMRRAHFCLSQNAEDVATARKHRLCDAERIAFLGNGIDCARFVRSDVSDAIRASLSAEISIDSGTLVVGMVGRLVREKGYLELFEAFREVRNSLPGAMLICAGPEEGEKRDRVTRADVVRAGLEEGAVRFLGYRTDVVELLSMMDVLVLPSHREGYPRVVMEAAAMGLPTVVTDIRGSREAVDDRRTGLIVPLKSPRELAAAIIELLTDGPRRREMGKVARAVALQRFDERLVFERVRRTYDLLQRQGTSRTAAEELQTVLRSTLAAGVGAC
jgi:glycosyltransferase involved in cell wall biosynthesis